MDRSRLGLFHIVDDLAIDFEPTSIVEHFAWSGIHLENNGVKIILRQL
jgi:hypothetical protein